MELIVEIISMNLCVVYWLKYFILLRLDWKFHIAPSQQTRRVHEISPHQKSIKASTISDHIQNDVPAIANGEKYELKMYVIKIIIVINPKKGITFLHDKKSIVRDSILFFLLRLRLQFRKENTINTKIKGKS